MLLKRLYENEADIPEDVKQFYKEVGGKWRLQAEGLDKIDEFRQSAIDAIKERDEIRKKMLQFDGVDPEKYHEYETKLQKINDRELIEKGDYEALLAENKKRWEKESQRQIEEVKKSIRERDDTIGSLKNNLAVLKIDNVAAQKFNGKAKLREGALPYLQRDAREIFALDDSGEAVAMDGDKKKLNKVGEPYSWDDFVDESIKTKPWFFEGSKSAEADGGEGGRGGGGGLNTDGIIIR